MFLHQYGSVWRHLADWYVWGCICHLVWTCHTFAFLSFPAFLHLRRLHRHLLYRYQSFSDLVSLAFSLVCPEDFVPSAILFVQPSKTVSVLSLIVFPIFGGYVHIPSLPEFLFVFVSLRFCSHLGICFLFSVFRLISFFSRPTALLLSVLQCRL